MTNKVFATRAEQLIGISYKECDCIGVARKAANISCQGTNWLWRSINNSPKYRYLPVRGTGTPPKLIEGLLLFRIRFGVIPDGYTDTPDCHHVGILVYRDGWKVIQSNPSPGVYISSYNPSQWDGWGELKQVDYSVAPPDPDPVPVEKTDSQYIRETWEMVKVLYDAYIRGQEQHD